MTSSRIEYAITSSQIQIVAGDRQRPAFLAHPAGGGQHPGIVLLGHDPASTRQTANRLAQRGLYVIAPALDTTPANTGPAGIRAAIQALRTHNHCNGSLCLLGLDPAGSALAVRMSPMPGRLAALAALGTPLELAGSALRENQRPLLLIYGGPVTPKLRRLQYEFAPTKDKALLIYPNASGQFLIRPASEIDRRCAEYAWTHLLAFLEQHLTWPSTTRPPVI